jgi:plasmid maintenance system antidote protein VapI
LRLEQVFGLQMRTMLAMQSAHDEAKVRREQSRLRLKPFRPTVAA